MDALVVVFIIFFVIVYKVNKAAQDSYSDSAAGKWAAQVQDEYEEDTMSFLERRRVKKQLLTEARELESQAKYGSLYERKAMKRQANELRRQASNL